MTRFSIITVCYNAGDKLIETIEDILRQTYDDFEIVIKDGGSTDGSLEKVKAISDDRVHVFESSDKGIYDAMNQAVSLSKGNYILFLNAGDKFYSQDVLEKVASKNLPKANTILYGDTYFEAFKSMAKAPKKITGSVCYRNIPCHQAIFYSRDTLLERGFDITYRIRADFEHFSYSYFTGKRDFVYLDLPICFYEGGGFSEKKENRKKDRDEYFRAVKSNIPWTNRFIYRATLILTLHRLRKFLNENPKTSKYYQKLRSLI